VEDLQPVVDDLWTSIEEVADAILDDDTQEVRGGGDAAGDDDEADAWAEERPGDLYLSRRLTVEIAKRIRGHAAERNLGRIREILPELADHLQRYPGQVTGRVEARLLGVIEDLDGLEPVLVYERPDAVSWWSGRQHSENFAQLFPSAARQSEILPVIASISDELIVTLGRRPELLYQLSPRAFEELMAEVFASLGYTVQLTAQTRDGGKDLIAVASLHGIEMRLLVECKRYARDRKVDVGLVRQLYGVKQMERATKAILATTSYFSPDARSVERQFIHELELKDYDAVVRWIRAAGLRRGVGGGKLELSG
jgi:hypothetical protein